MHRPDLADLADLAAGDLSLTEVVEQIRPCPALSARPVSADQIGELLFRAARIRSIAPASVDAEVSCEVSHRPYLSISGLYELELYLSLHSCAGLPRGIYHYDPQGHALTLIHDTESELDEVLDSAMIGSGAVRWSPAMITVTARVARSSWMHDGITYALLLTHVGALQQMLCLAATAMGLAACVPTIDPGDVVDSALRLDWPREIGVGEFIFGY